MLPNVSRGPGGVSEWGREGGSPADELLRGFTCDNRNGNTCVAVISTGTQTAVTTATCSGSQMVLARATFPDIITATVTTSTATNAGAAVATETITREIILLAPMFQLNFQSSDLETTTTSATTRSASTSLAGSSATTGASSAPSDSTLPAAADGQARLSTGAIAGIAVGAALGGLLFGLALATWLVMRKRKRRREAVEGAAAAAAAAAAADRGGSQEWIGKPQEVYSAKGSAMELGGWTPTEMPVDGTRTEMPVYGNRPSWADRPPLELAADPGGHGYARGRE